MKAAGTEVRPRRVSKSRWVAYATACTASCLAGGQSAEAAIHYSGPIDTTIPGDAPGIVKVRFDLDQSGDWIAFVHRSTIFQFDILWAGFQAHGRRGGSFRGVGFDNDFYYVHRLERGEFVSAGSFNNRRKENLSGFGELAGVFSGYFVFPRVSFIGFAFDGGSGTQYGWARVKMSGYKKGNGFQIWDYAWADPGEPIQVGQISSDGQQVPDQGSLGLLAAGAAGVAAWKKRRRSPAGE